MYTPKYFCSKFVRSEDIEEYHCSHCKRLTPGTPPTVYFNIYYAIYYNIYYTIYYTIHRIYCTVYYNIYYAIYYIYNIL